METYWKRNPATSGRPGKAGFIKPRDDNRRISKIRQVKGMNIIF